MADPTKNPDGTTQVSPPTKSAFAPQKSDPAPSKDTGDKDEPAPEHVHGLIDSLKGLLGIGGPKEVDEGGKPVDSAVAATEKGVAEAPGNTANY